MLLDISSSPHGFESGKVGQVSACSEGQLYDPFFKKCRTVFCAGANSTWKNGGCTTTTTSSTATTPSSDNENSSNASSLFATCPKFILGRGDYSFGSNETVYVPIYNKTYAKDDYRVLKLGDGSSVVEICAVGFETVEKFTPLMGYISVFCILLSIACLVMHLGATVLVPELQNLSGKNMAALCTALLMAYVFFLAGQFRFFKENACAVVGAGLYYSFLAAFCWMNCMAFDVWRSLRCVSCVFVIPIERLQM